MPYPRQIALAKFRVTTVVICALCILAVLAYLLTGGNLLTAKSTLYLYIADSTGVAKNSPVRVNGIDIGKVRQIELSGSSDPNRVVRVVMTVEANRLRAIPIDSVAQVGADTLVGDRFIDIASGKQHAFVQPDSEITFQPPTDLMKSLDLAQFEKQLRQMDEVMTQIESGESLLGEFIVGEGMYDNLLGRLTELHAGIRRATASTGQIGSLLYSDVLYRQIAAPLRQLDDALSSAQAGQGTAGRLLRENTDYEALSKDIAGLRRSLAELREGRGAAGELLASDKLWNDVNRKVGALMESVDQVNTGPLFATAALYESLNGSAAEMRDVVRDFRQSPKKYLRIKIF